jgi:hypothetical protein
MNSVSRSGASLPELLAARARGASDGRLVLDVVGGLLAAGAALLWRRARALTEQVSPSPMA